MLIHGKGGVGMPDNYGELVRLAREQHSPPMTAKQLAEKLKVKAPFILEMQKCI